MDIKNLFNEDGDGIITRFSSVILFVFIYYTLSYYFITNSEECLKRPHVSRIIILIVLHILHIIVLKVLHDREMISYMWLVAMLPLVLYLIYAKYQESIRKKEERQRKEMYAQLQAQQNKEEGEFMRNVTPQKPNAPPMGGQQFVGISNNGNRLGDQVPQHQMQHNNPLPPSNPAPTFSQPIQIARQPESMTNTFTQGAPQYDSNSMNNMRTNNTVTEPIQHMQPLDMQAIGGSAGSAGLNGFDPYGGSFASF